MRINSAARCSDGRRGHCGRQFSGSTYRLHPLMWGAKGGIGHLQVTVRALPIRCGCQAVEAGRGRDRVFPCRYAGRRQDGRCRDRRGRHRNGQVPTQVRAASRHSGSDSVRARFAAGRRFAMTRLLKKFSKCHLIASSSTWKGCPNFPCHSNGADVGILLAFMFAWNRVGALVLITALSCFPLPTSVVSE